MSKFIVVYKKEMAIYFYSSLAYILCVAFAIITGFFFFSAVFTYSQASMHSSQNPMFMHLNLQDWLIAPLMNNTSVITMLISPLLTMRLISEEKHTGTLELLFAYPLGDINIIIGKYLASLTVLILILFITLIHMFILGCLSNLYWPAIIFGYLGLILEGGSFIALGLLTSALSESQFVAAIMSFFGVLFFWIIGWVSTLVSSELGLFLRYFSLGAHFESFSRGLVDTADIIYYLLFISFFLFLTLRALEAKR